MKTYKFIHCTTKTIVAIYGNNIEHAEGLGGINRKYWNLFTITK